MSSNDCSKTPARHHSRFDDINHALGSARCHPSVLLCEIRYGGWVRKMDSLSTFVPSAVAEVVSATSAAAWNHKAFRGRSDLKSFRQ